MSPRRTSSTLTGRTDTRRNGEGRVLGTSADRRRLILSPQRTGPRLKQCKVNTDGLQVENHSQFLSRGETPALPWTLHLGPLNFPKPFVGFHISFFPINSPTLLRSENKSRKLKKT